MWSPKLIMSQVIGKKSSSLMPASCRVLVDRLDKAVRGPGDDRIIGVSHDHVGRAGGGHGRCVLDIVVAGDRL